MENKNLSERTYELLRQIPKGKVVTYGEIAIALGNRHLARAVGNILHKNPDGIANPCFKVVNSKGYLAPAYVFGGVDKQKDMLIADGVAVTDYKVDLEKYGYCFKK